MSRGIKRATWAAGVCVVAGGAWAMPALDDGAIHTVMINYVPGEMSVYVDDLSRPELTIPIDLRDVSEPGLGVLGPDGGAWVGFTAGTAAAQANQDILSWSLGPALREHSEVDRALSPVGFDLESFADVSMLTMRGDAARANDRLRILAAVSQGSSSPPQGGPLSGWEPLPRNNGEGYETTCYAPDSCMKRAAAWHVERQRLDQGFSTVFRFQLTATEGESADGFAFVIQNEAPGAIGGDGNFGLGYWDGEVSGDRIAPAVAIEFDAAMSAMDPAGPGHACGCTHDPANHVSLNATIAPAMFYSIDAISDRLVIVEADTGLVRPIGTLGFDAHEADLTVSGGRLYAIDSDPAGPERLYVVDHETGGATLIGTVNLAGTPVELVKGLAARRDGSLVAGFGDGDRAYRLGDMGFDGTIVLHANLRSTGAPDPDVDALAVSRTGRLLASDTDLVGLDQMVCFVDVATLPPRYDVASICPITPDVRSVDDMMLANGSIFGVDGLTSRVQRFDPVTGDVIASVPIEAGYALGAMALAPAELCAEDVDYDNDVDVADFGAFVQAFGAEGLIRRRRCARFRAPRIVVRLRLVRRGDAPGGNAGSKGDAGPGAEPLRARLRPRRREREGAWKRPVPERGPRA